jgi:hypothetical protein
VGSHIQKQPRWAIMPRMVQATIKLVDRTNTAGSIELKGAAARSVQPRQKRRNDDHISTTMLITLPGDNHSSILATCNQLLGHGRDALGVSDPRCSTLLTVGTRVTNAVEAR